MYVPWGATQQDNRDPGLVRRRGEALDILGDRLDVLAGRLATLADAERGTVMLARTRGQQTTPTSFGLKVAGWLAPLDRHLHRLRVLEGNLQVLSFAGAAGNLSALGGSGSQNRAAALEADPAEETDLTVPQ